jgi:hypothetical protein
MSTSATRPAGWKALASGLLVAIVGPPLGALGVFILPLFSEAQIAANIEEAIKAVTVFFRVAVPFAYIFGDIPALIAGLAVGIGIYRVGRIGWACWIGLALVLGFFATFTLDAMQGRNPTMPSPANALFFIGPAVFASIILRILIVKFGWMRGSDTPAHPVAKT